jgi:thiamine pyrophosphate-dependent acetolactate synthase large subunit-like protein
MTQDEEATAGADQTTGTPGAAGSEPEAAPARNSSDPIDRRAFIRRAALGAGAVGVAAATGFSGAAQASPDPSASAGEPPIQRTEAHRSFKDAPIREFSFPAQGAELFARACREEGLAALFCCPGNYSIVSALANAGIPTYGGRTEGPMCSAADAFIRVTGEVAAASGTEGPGFTNMICAIAAANAARTPLLVLASNMSLEGDDTERGIQRGYQQPTTEGIKKYGKRIVDPARVTEYAGYAFRSLKTGIPGPVHLDFVEESAGRASRVDSELDLKNDWGRTRYRTESTPYPDPTDIDALIDLLKKARRPMIVANMGVFYNKAWEALRLVAERGNIPVCEAGPMRGHFPDDHPLSASTAPNALGSVDLAILVGQYCMPAVGEYAFDIDCRYVRIDPEAGDIGRNLPMDLGIVANERAALEVMHEKMPALRFDAWVAEVAAARQTFEEENDAHYRQGLSYTDAVHPAVIATELNRFLYHGDIPKDQVTVVSGGFGIGRYTRRRLRAYRPGQICNGAFQYGSIGPDVGYAVGAGVACDLGVGPQQPYQGTPVLAVTGDAGFGYSGFEVETLAKYRIPAIIVVYNNNAWGTWAGYAGQPRVAHVHQFQENVQYHRIAEALGGHGESVRFPEELRPALDRAWQVAVNERLPCVINRQAKKEFWLGGNEWGPGMLGKIEPGCMSYNH